MLQRMLVIGLLVTGVFCSAPLMGAESVDILLQEVPEDDAESVWGLARRLSDTDVDALLALSASPNERSAAERVVIGTALLHAGKQREGVVLLEAVVRDDALPLSRRTEALDAIGAFGGGYAQSRLRALLEEDKISADAAAQEMLRLSVAKGLWRLTHGAQASEVMETLASSASSETVRDMAVIALGRFGQYSKVQERLEALAAMPGELGDQARTLVALHGRVNRRAERDQFASDLIGEVVYKIRKRYAYDESDPKEAEQSKPQYLASQAARALVRSLDDFNDYLDEESYQDMLDQMHADYGGIGAYVGMRDGLCTILTPMFGRPAHQAGLRSMDIVTHIDDVDISGMDIASIIKRLKGKPGTQVRLKVVRRGPEGWGEGQDVVITRDLITLPMVMSQLLPGDIGYVRLNGFQEDPFRQVSTSGQLKKVLEGFKREGVRGVVLDLRNNPGGLLNEAVNVSECFLPRNTKIVSSKGRVRPEETYYSRITGDPIWTGPLVVLINEGSASASEIVAGALRDTKRATLVGENSFGKGSVQMLIPIETTNHATRLKLTVAKYYLPGGECIHGRDKGIKPDVELSEPTLSEAERQLRWKLIENRDVDIWVEQKWDAHGDAFSQALEFDGGMTDVYPEFDQLLALLQERYPEIALTPELVREELRHSILMHLRDGLGRMDHPVDVQASDVLQRGLVILGEQIGGLPDVPLYNSFRDKWSDEGLVAGQQAPAKSQ